MNPFVFGTVVKGRNFFDREKELKQIVQTLSGGNNLVLYAPRRFGKTSLVFKAMEILEKQGFTCIYFDFMQIYSPESFVRLYTKTLSKYQSNYQKFAQLFAALVKNIRPIISISDNGKPEFSIDFANSKINETTLSDLLDLPEKMESKNKKILLFFDEFQEVKTLQKLNFEAILRSKIQHQQNVNYLFFGSKTHLINEMFNSKKRAFYNSAAQLAIGYLPENETIEYLQSNFKQFNIVLKIKDAQYILTLSKKIPHYIQLLAAEIWQYMITEGGQITVEIIDICAQKVIINNNDYYQELFDKQSDTKKNLLVSLTQNGKNIYSSEYIKKNLLSPASTLQRAVKGLTEDGVIDKLSNEYYISDPFFRLFLIQNK